MTLINRLISMFTSRRGSRGHRSSRGYGGSRGSSLGTGASILRSLTRR
jgi:hypothetical protein